MSDADGKIIVITGIQGAGKSTVGRMLPEHFERGAHIEADALQRMIVSGGRWVTDDGGPGQPQGEAQAQLRLRLHNACLLARSFSEAGFVAVVDDIILGSRWDDLREELAGVPFYFVVLGPDVETVIARDAARDRPVGREWGLYLDAALRRTMAGVGLWIDSAGQSPVETTSEILRRLDEAVITGD